MKSFKKQWNLNFKNMNQTTKSRATFELCTTEAFDR
jgi:hypothetical protein